MCSTCQQWSFAWIWMPAGHDLSHSARQATGDPHDRALLVWEARWLWNTETSNDSNCLGLDEMMFPELSGLTAHFNVTSPWQLVHRHSTSIPDADAAPGEQTHRDSGGIPAQWWLILPQMKKEMFLTQLLPTSALRGILTSGNTRNRKSNTE